MRGAEENIAISRVEKKRKEKTQDVRNINILLLTCQAGSDQNRTRIRSTPATPMSVQRPPVGILCIKYQCKCVTIWLQLALSLTILCFPTLTTLTTPTASSRTPPHHTSVVFSAHICISPDPTLSVHGPGSHTPSVSGTQGSSVPGRDGGTRFTPK